MDSRTNTQFPRVAIKFCVQCKWNLRAAYYAQELLQTFSDTIGEIALIPVTGGIFTVTIYHHRNHQDQHKQQQTSKDANAGADAAGEDVAERAKDLPTDMEIKTEIEEHLIWDRKRDSGFPETKELKNRVRNVIDPLRDMGHVDRALKKGNQKEKEQEQEQQPGGGGGAESAMKGGSGGDGGGSGSASAKGTVVSTSNHAEHSKDASSASVDDCEECRMAAEKT